VFGLAQLIKKSIRNSDITARFGGEEFVILLPETNISKAKKTYFKDKKKNKIRKHIKKI